MNKKLFEGQIKEIFVLKKIYAFFSYTKNYYFCLISLLMLLNPGISQKAFAQELKLSIDQSDVTLKEVFKEIESKTGYTFVYNTQEINLNERISIKQTDIGLPALLECIVHDKNISYRITNTHIILFKIKIQKISGVITDESGIPIVGANVIEKGTTNGTVSDMNGEFLLSVPENSTLSISYIGYNNVEIKLKGQTSLVVKLKENIEALSEVVVIGYGTMKKSDLTGTVVRADLSQIQEAPNISIGEMLQGTIPGLNVGAVNNAGQDPSISIRGRTSISGSNSPLIVMDGIVFRGNLVDINPNDIQSIDILKDASAAAIYGSQASNGVILLTSKIGQEMSKPVIEYSGNFSVQQASNRNMKLYDREGFLKLIGDRFLEESRIGDDLSSPNPQWDPSVHMFDRTSLDGFNKGVSTDWWDLLTNDLPYIQTHNLSVRGKNELSSYFFSMGYTDQKNMIINDTYKRYNVRINMDMKVLKWFKVGVQSFFTVSDYSGISPNVAQVVDLPPIVTPYDDNGNLLKNPYKFNTNPLMEIEEDNLSKRNTLSGNFYADIDVPFIKGLNYHINFSQNLIEGKEYLYNPLAQNFTGSASKSNNSQYIWSVDNIVTYKNTFGKHAVNATFVYGVERRNYETTTASSKIFTDGTLGYNNLGLGQADLQRAGSGAWQESSVYTMLRLNYTFNNRYMFTGTVRRDGFSGFGVNNKFGVFPSASVAWRLNEEEFLNQTSWLDNLKLRLSYGTNGNRTVGRYQTLAKMGISSGGYLFGDGAAAEATQWISSLANADLKWETTRTFNMGIDFSCFDNRLFGNVEYYISNTRNLLYDINIPDINGFGSIASNIGKLKNTGQEFSITGVPVQTKDFDWNITFNFSRNRNKVISILGIDADGDGREDDLISSKIFIGKPYGVCYDYNIIGMWQMQDKLNGTIPAGFTYGTYKVEDLNNDKVYTAADDRKIIGYTDPAYRFSIQNTLRYKNWELKFFINSIQGGKNRYMGQPGNEIPNPDNIFQNNFYQFDYWTPENPDARYKQIGYYTEVFGENFSPYIQRSFVRLQDVTLSYNVPSHFLERFKIKRLKAYITGKNLLTFTDWDGWDPETGTGLSKSSYPLMRSYTFGLNVEF